MFQSTTVLVVRLILTAKYVLPLLCPWLNALEVFLSQGPAKQPSFGHTFVFYYDIADIFTPHSAVVLEFYRETSSPGETKFFLDMTLFHTLGRHEAWPQQLDCVFDPAASNITLRRLEVSFCFSFFF
jgi:hypothetical protein